MHLRGPASARWQGVTRAGARVRPASRTELSWFHELDVTRDGVLADAALDPCLAQLVARLVNRKTRLEVVHAREHQVDRAAIQVAVGDAAEEVLKVLDGGDCGAAGARWEDGETRGRRRAIRRCVCAAHSLL